MVRMSRVNSFTVLSDDASVSVKANAWEGFHKVDFSLPDFTLLTELYVSVGQARALRDALSAVVDDLS